MNKIPVAILAATGSVGQRFVQLLDNHPWFEVAALTSSERRLGKTFGQSVKWILPEPMPEWAAHMPLLASDPEEVQTPLVFSALPTDIARDLEPGFAQAGSFVCSNASAYRKAEDVPILLPEVNPDHANLVKYQQKNHCWNGGIVTNPNCTSTGMTVILKALQDSFGLRRVFAVSLQALSGAGYPGVPSMDIIDNVIPFISGEEEKVEFEARKMLGKLLDDHIELADFKVSAHTNRVAVSDGHTVCLSIELENKASPEEAIAVLRAYQAPDISRSLPSSPHPSIQVREEPDRPQPRLDRMTGRGMTSVAGRIRPDPLFDLKLVTLSHNTVRGAAGGSIYNAELLVAMGMI